MAPAEVYQAGVLIDTKWEGGVHRGTLGGKPVTITGRKTGFVLETKKTQQFIHMDDSISLDDGTIIKAT